jgi:hypothetical protein
LQHFALLVQPSHVLVTRGIDLGPLVGETIHVCPPYSADFD